MIRGCRKRASKRFSHGYKQDAGAFSQEFVNDLFVCKTHAGPIRICRLMRSIGIVLILVLGFVSLRLWANGIALVPDFVKLGAPAMMGEWYVRFPLHACVVISPSVGLVVLASLILRLQGLSKKKHYITEYTNTVKSPSSPSGLRHKEGRDTGFF